MGDNNNENDSVNVLAFRIEKNSTLWGKEEQYERLQELALSLGPSSHRHSTAGSQSEKPRQQSASQVVFVHGPSGSGKTSLCHELKKRFPSYYFLLGKFDQYRDHSSPYSAIVQALDGLLALNPSSKSLSSSNDGGDHPQLDLSIQNLLKRPEALVLCELVPSFSKLVNDSQQNMPERAVSRKSTDKYMVSAERLIVALLVFLRDLCKALEQPLIFALDDLQWCDPNSQAVISALIHHSSESLSNLLLVGIYRDDGESLRELQPFLDTVATKPNVADISVSNLDYHQTSMLVFDLLSIEHDRATQKELEFAQLIHRKTDGNPYFVLQFLAMLDRNDLLHYNYATNQFQWDLHAVQLATTVADNVVAVLTQKVQCLSLTSLRVLELAACLGFTFDSVVLEKVANHFTSLSADNSQPHSDDMDGNTNSSTPLPFSSILEIAVSENLIEHVAGALYHFTHDKIQQSIYELIPLGKRRDEIHWQIGKFIKENLSTTDADSQSRLLLLSVDQLNRGSSCIGNETERLNLIEWNYEASLLAKQQNGLSLVGLFLGRAMNLIKDEDWETHYECILNVHNTIVEYQSMSNKLEEGIAMIKVILGKAKHPEDTIIALAARSNISLTLYKFGSAISDARRALKLCGETLPPANRFSVMKGVREARRLVQGKTDDDLLALPEMVDPLKKQAMKILLTACVCGFISDSTFNMLCYLCMLRVTLKCGFSELAGTAFACYGHLLVRTGDRQGGIRFANLALRASSKNQTIDKTVVPIYAYAFVLHETLPTTSMMEGWLEGWRKGLEFGDTLHGSIDLCCYCDAYKFSGLPLDSFAADIVQFANQLKILRQDSIQCFMLPDMQLALMLTGKAKDPLRISWDVIRQQGYLNENANPEESNAAMLLMDSTQMFIAYVLRDANVAEQSLRKILALPKESNFFDGNHFSNQFFALTEGFVGFWLASLKQATKYRLCGNRALKWLKKKKNINTVPLHKLLEAQRAAASTSVDIETVLSMYEEVSVMLARSGFVHYAAIANEQLGEFLLSQPQDEHKAEAQVYLEKSLDLYAEWGASVKVELLARVHKLVPRSGSGRSGTSLRGKERFRPNLDTVENTSLLEAASLG